MNCKKTNSFTFFYDPSPYCRYSSINVPSDIARHSIELSNPADSLPAEFNLPIEIIVPPVYIMMNEPQMFKPAWIPILWHP